MGELLQLHHLGNIHLHVPKPFEQIPPYFNCLHNMMSMYIFVSYVFGTLV